MDALKILSPIDVVPSNNIVGSLKSTASTTSMVSNRLFDEFLMCLYIEGRDPTLSAAKIIGDIQKGENIDLLSDTDVKAAIVLDGSAVFNKTKLVGYIDDKDSTAYTLIRGKNMSFDISFPCDNNNNYGTITFANVKASQKPTVTNNKPKMTIDIKGDAVLSEYNCKINLQDKKEIKKVEKMADKALKKMVNQAIDKTKKDFGVDIYGFGEMFYKNKYSYWKKIKND
jgi:spore germination protein KC